MVLARLRGLHPVSIGLVAACVLLTAVYVVRNPGGSLIDAARSGFAPWVVGAVLAWLKMILFDLWNRRTDFWMDLRWATGLWLVMVAGDLIVS